MINFVIYFFPSNDLSHNLIKKTSTLQVIVRDKSCSLSCQADTPDDRSTINHLMTNLDCHRCKNLERRVL